MRKKLNFENIYCIFLIVLVAISIIPLIILCKYNHPSADDFNYSVVTFHEWNNSHSIWRLICAGFDTSKNFYKSWQGLYSSAFFLSLQPAIFGEKYYVLTGIIMICVIIFSTCYFFSYIAKKVIGSSVLDGIAVGSVASFLMIQWMPSCVQGLYWYNGAINYGLFYSILLFLICFSISLHKASNRKEALKKSLICCVLGLVLEGGNHVTAFMGLLFVFLLILIEFFNKKKGKAICYGIIFLFMVGCFLFNISSPGTRIRWDGFEKYRMNFVESIKNAVIGGIKNVNSWIDLAPIPVVLLVIPIFLKQINIIIHNTKFKFSNPVLILICSIAWICAMYCPPLYAMGYLGEGRLHNIVYYSYIILLFINVFYFSGWIVCKLNKNHASGSSGYISVKWICCAIVLLIGLGISRWDTTWSAQAINKLKLGEPQLFSQQAYDRNTLLLDSAGQDMVVKEYSIKPDILFWDDITEDPNDWRNTSVRKFYDLHSIIIIR